MREIFILLIAIFLMFVSGCSPTLSTSTPDGLPRDGGAETGYPPPMVDATLSYPAPAESGYPAPQAALPSVNTKMEIVPFRIQKPIDSGATEVRGTGPKGISIILSDVTMADSFLAKTTIQANGEFVFVVPALEAGHRIGIKLGDLSGTEWANEPFDNEGFFGDEAKLIPEMAFYYDTAMVR